jgi:hypothetical protein
MPLNVDIRKFMTVFDLRIKDFRDMNLSQRMEAIEKILASDVDTEKLNKARISYPKLLAQYKKTPTIKRVKTDKGGFKKTDIPTPKPPVVPPKKPKPKATPKGKEDIKIIREKLKKPPPKKPKSPKKPKPETPKPVPKPKPKPEPEKPEEYKERRKKERNKILDELKKKKPKPKPKPKPEKPDFIRMRVYRGKTAPPKKDIDMSGVNQIIKRKKDASNVVNLTIDNLISSAVDIAESKKQSIFKTPLYPPRQSPQPRFIPPSTDIFAKARALKKQRDIIARIGSTAPNIVPGSF